MRTDDPQGVMAHQDRFYGGTGLIVLGGPSGKTWEKLRDEIEPDVLLTVNGATRLPGADYWLLTENMNFSHTGKKKGDEYLAGFLHVLDKDNTAETLLVSHRSWNLLSEYGIGEDRCVKIRRKGYSLDKMPADFTFREYGEGYLAGPTAVKGWKDGVRVLLGTVGLQALHHMGIVGCFEVHTIGFDLMFKGRHHWYEHPEYKAYKFRKESMFTEYKGHETQHWWIETARYLKKIEHLFERDNITWRDHSNGLLKVEGLKCAT